MNTASLENCKRLYELSGWDDEQLTHDWYEPGNIKNMSAFPRYDLGYLLRKLEAAYVAAERYIEVGFAGGEYYASVIKCDDDGVEVARTNYHTDTPEDAACKLAIELFKQGVLTKPEKEG